MLRRLLLCPKAKSLPKMLQAGFNLKCCWPLHGHTASIYFMTVSPNYSGVTFQASCLQDSETLEQITRDVVRTHPDMEFFTGENEEAERHRQVLLLC